MIFKFCMACPAAPLSRLSRTAAAIEDQQSDAARTVISSPWYAAQQEKPNPWCKVNACNTLKSHVQASEARCSGLHSQCNLQISDLASQAAALQLALVASHTQQC